MRIIEIDDSYTVYAKSINVNVGDYIAIVGKYGSEGFVCGLWGDFHGTGRSPSTESALPPGISYTEASFLQKGNPWTAIFSGHGMFTTAGTYTIRMGYFDAATKFTRKGELLTINVQSTGNWKIADPFVYNDGNAESDSYIREV